MEKDQQKIKNIIFDLGGVLLNIDYHKTVDAFAKLGMENPIEAFSKEVQAEFFQTFEKGLITENVFVSEIQKQFKDVTRQSVIDAWNALLGDFPVKRYEYLQSLKSKYRLFLLSNTNIIHLKAFKDIIESSVGWNEFEALFEGTCYSHEMKMRKPDTEIFHKIMEMYNLQPHETYFIDDTQMHVEAARTTGIKAFHLRDHKEIWDTLAHLSE